jgi:uncharacterized membrane protein YeaQ/YmgE (transglycosylase-associated protein family)
VFGVLLLAIVGLGLFAGAIAQLLLGTSLYKIDWAEALIAGLVGSFVGGLLVSLLAGDGLRLRPSGILGSIIGAIVVSAGFAWYRRRATPPTASGRNPARHRR